MMHPWRSHGSAQTILLVAVLQLISVPVLGFLVQPPAAPTGRSVLTSSPPPSASVVPVFIPQRKHVVVRQSTIPDGSGGMPPMPLGGESEYEYESEFSDQQAVREGGDGGRETGSWGGGG